MATVLRYTAFSDRPEGGNPAGVVLDAAGLDDAEMQRIAADVGYSETAFVLGVDGDDVEIRYFSPLAEVPFCGHATIATGVAWGERRGPGALRLHTQAGEVALDVSVDDERPVATLTSVAPHTEPVSDEDLAEGLAALGWDPADLDPALPARVGYAGAKHLILAAGFSDRLDSLDYDFDRLGALMAAQDWTTVQLIYRTGATTFRSRNPFPPGGVVEDPATGASAAALGGYLRELGLVELPARVTIHQGEEMGRPSVLEVAIPADAGSGISVSGTAVPISG